MALHTCRGGGMVDAGDLKSPGFRAVRVRVPSAVAQNEPRLLLQAGLVLFYCKRLRRKDNNDNPTRARIEVVGSGTIRKDK